MEKSQEFLGNKPFNLFFEINQVFFCFSEKKNGPDIKEIIVIFIFIVINEKIRLRKEHQKGKQKKPRFISKLDHF